MGLRSVKEECAGRWTSSRIWTLAGVLALSALTVSAAEETQAASKTKEPEAAVESTDEWPTEEEWPEEDEWGAEDEGGKPFEIFSMSSPLTSKASWTSAAVFSHSGRRICAATLRLLRYGFSFMRPKILRIGPVRLSRATRYTTG